MNRALKACAMALPLVMLTAVSSMADVKTRDKSQVKFEGMLGRMMGMVAGKAAKEGVVTTVAVKGDRKVEMNDTFGRIVDLKEEKVYELDVKKKTYEVVTFEELRRRLREARDKAEKQAPKDEQNQQQDRQAAGERSGGITDHRGSSWWVGHTLAAAQLGVTLNNRYQGM